MTSKILNYFLAAILLTGVITSCDKEEDQVEICSNGIDDDGDGQIDCADGDCAGKSSCLDIPSRSLTGALNTMTMHKDTIYIISRFTYVPEGKVLTVNPGTIIKAETGDGANATALIISRGGKIIANGSANEPIILTSVDDDIVPGETISSLNPSSDGGKWGGLIVLGKGKISAQDEKGGDQTSIEGVPSEFDFSKYGGNIENDNAGSLSFLSIRFTGTTLANDDEIQGLTLGGVGSATTVKNIEVLSSNDDGIEIFGGNVNVSNILVAYQADDGFDIDQSYNGTISNGKVIIFNPAEGNDAMELDGPEGTLNNTGKYRITNCTFINKGAGNCRAGTLKSGSQGTIDNCSFVDFNNWIYVDGGSATTNYVNGDLKVTNSDFDISEIAGGIGASSQDSLINTIFVADGNTATNISSKGSDADFSWTMSSSIGILD